MRVGYVVRTASETFTWTGDTERAGLSIYDDADGYQQTVLDVAVSGGEIVVTLGPLGTYSHEILRVPIPEARSIRAS